MKRRLLTLLLFVAVQSLYAQSRMSSADVSFLYNPNNEFLIDHRVAQQGNQVKVYIRFILNSGIVKISDYQIQFDIRNSYIDERRVNALKRIDKANLISTGFREFIYAIEFEKTDEQKLIVLEVMNVARGKQFIIDIPLANKKKLPNRPFLIFEAERDVPYFSRFINSDQKFRLVNVFGETGKYQITGFENNKAIAMPPFDAGKPKNTREVQIDTLYGAAESEKINLSNPGYYLINDAQALQNSKGILITDKFYPYFGDYQKIVQPLIFISTNDEFQNIRSAADYRMAFEEFATTRVSNGGKMAQDFVRLYYERIREAGHLFTADKEGWKTDRGMVYQIYGTPLQVFRNEDSELWIYALPNGSRTRFAFELEADQNNQISYHLMRSDKYKDSWMEAVTNWRSGKVIN